MINQFWNLCRACPSVNIDKLHSEYRSTYRWHEYTPQSQHEVIRKPPTSQETKVFGNLYTSPLRVERRAPRAEAQPRQARRGMGRRRYDWKTAPGGVGSGMQESGDGEPRVRVSQSEERSRRFLQPSHRSRSEGPLGRDLDDDSFLVSEYKTQFAWVRRTPSARGPEAAPLLEVEKPPQSTKNQVNANGVAGGASGGAGGGAVPASDPQPAAEHQLPRTPRKSKSMGRIHGGGSGPEVGEGAAGGPEAAGSTQQQQQQGGGGNQEGKHDQAPTRTDAAGTTPAWHPGHRRTPSDGVAWRHSKGLEADRIIGGEMLGSGEEDKLYKRAYKSEYRKKFRPFSQYQYVDGRFHKVKTDEATAAAGTSESPNNWYKEVIELRRQAGQYRARHDIGDVWRTVQHRGWGVETASERLAEIYSKQAELWEQVSRRSSLQALSLASASPSRPISKAEKEIENSRRSSPIKHSKSSRERPSTAPPKPKPAAVHTQKPSDKTDGKTSKESTPRHHYERTTGTTGGRSVSVGPENRSPKRTSRPPSTHATAPATKPERRPRPSEETDSKKDKEKEILPKDGPKDILKDIAPKDGSKEPVEAVKESTARKSTPEPRFDPEKYEPVVKTPPEPTRVKSPDQVGKWVMVKSPDPVNWTVPLDTGKTFTVTHNIPEATHCLRIPRGESARGTPSSEYRHVLESRTRQTPEPTKISQGSLAGTPVSSIASEAKSHSQEQPKPTTATIVDSKVDEKSLEKKTEPKPVEAKPQESKISETKIPEGKSLDGDSFSSKLDAKANTKPYEIMKDTKLAEVKEEPKPTDSKELETNLLDAKVQETRPFESLVSEPKSSFSMLSEPKASEIKAPEPPKSDPVAEIKKSDNFEPKPFQSQPLQQQQQQQVPSSTPAPTQASPMDIVPPSGAVDCMTMSMFGSLNGMNGKSSGTPSPTKPEVPLPSSDPVKDVCAPESKPATVRNVPGTNLRCLDDPSFMFDQPSIPVTNSPKSGTYKVLEAPKEPQQLKSGGYHVLEAPEAPSDIKDLPDQSPTKPEAPIKPSPYRVLEAPIDPPSRPKGSPYRVLEAPDAPYYPQSQTVGEVQESKPPSLVSPSSGRTVSDALDKARTRFDSFWGGPKDKDPPSKV
ncbi:serine/arginine repetitive matrix protein 1 isoform X23 [Procambarus clarkii]|uniref:serine/arginine repetitive matrix protein 1 isoform X23 n=1 Tax=Procambarus clarkii TaxID=6728 RepID=UPI0037447837